MRYLDKKLSHLKREAPDSSFAFTWLSFLLNVKKLYKTIALATLHQRCIETTCNHSKNKQIYIPRFKTKETYVYLTSKSFNLRGTKSFRTPQQEYSFCKKQSTVYWLLDSLCFKYNIVVVVFIHLTDQKKDVIKSFSALPEELHNSNLVTISTCRSR